MKNLQTVTCILPAHNEGESIYQTILEIDETIGSQVSLTIFVSEDGSSDNTRDATALASSQTMHSEVIISEPSERLGYSKAVQRGISNSKGGLILFMDSDGQYDPADFQILLEAWRPKTMVVGVRTRRNDNLQRKFFSHSFKVIYQLLGFPKLMDPSSPFILIERDLVLDFATKNWYLNFGFWWEFQARCVNKNIEVVQIGVKHRIRTYGTTQVYKFRVLPRIALSHVAGLFKLKQELRQISNM